MGDQTLNPRVAGALSAEGWIVLANFLPAPLVAALRDEVIRHASQGELQVAGIGHGVQHRQQASVRSDRTRWLVGDTPAQEAYLAQMESLRLSINRGLFLGLFDYECHFAHYPPGAFYRRHRDAFSGDDARVVTTVLYLNEDWQERDGGELLVWPAGAAVEPITRVSPQGGTLVCFLSETFPHEVLPAQRDRYSIAGWFRRQGSSRILHR